MPVYAKNACLLLVPEAAWHVNTYTQTRTISHELKASTNTWTVDPSFYLLLALNKYS